MMQDPWTARLSEYLDGELDAGERTALERHLAACPSCTAALHELAQVVERARRLPARPPATDLWPGIAARIAAEGGAGAAPVPLRRRRWSFSVPELVAAAVAIAVLSGGGVWMLAGRLARRPGLLPPVAVSPAPTPATTPLARPAIAEQRYDAAVADLERVLNQGRGTLDSTTIRILERNLALIDSAIADARRALAADPGNGYLNAHLARTMRRKIDLLREAASIVAARS